MKTALVLGGGGARGAYEAGVVSYLRDELGRELGRHPTFDILCGTSIGALNAAYLASSAHQTELQGTQMVERWRSLTVEDVLTFGWGDAWRMARDFVGKPKDHHRLSERRAGLIDGRGLTRPLLQSIRWSHIGRNIRQGVLDALAVSATHVASGKTIAFIQQRRHGLPPWTHDPNFRPVRARIGPRHVLASAAIPILFAPLRIGGRLYVDGGIRLNVPLSPALRLGAQRLIVVALRAKARLPEQTSSDDPLAVEHELAFATAPFLAGKTLNAVLLDSVDQDIDRMRRLNSIVEAGVSAFGPGFTAAINDQLRGQGALPVRRVRNILVRPSHDIGRLAADFVRTKSFRSKNSLARTLLKNLVDRETPHEADLVSYLLFDGSFAEQLITLGREDARRMHDEWLRFFSDEPQSPGEAAQSGAH